MENIAKATIEVFQKSAEMNSNNPSGNGAVVQGGSGSNNSSTTSKMKPILRYVSLSLLKAHCFWGFLHEFRSLFLHSAVTAIMT